MPTDRFDLVIVGMGSGGMPAAEFAASLPIRTAVVERGRVGGDCLWTGCVPSKALLASAKAAHTMRTADRWGLPSVDPDIDTEAVWKRLRAVQEDIATSDDDPRRYEAMGLELVTGSARLVERRGGKVEVEVDGRRLSARYVLLCTGSEPVELPVEGLADAGYLTNENLFALDRAPRSVVMIGGGPIAIELAQALHRLGVAVTVLQKGDGFLPRDEPSLVERLVEVLTDEGVVLTLGVDVQRVGVEAGSKVVTGTVAGETCQWRAEEVIVAVGRRPSIEGLGLEGVGIGVGERGVEVDDRMRTAVPSVYAVGDLVGRYRFTHSAGHEAVRAVRDMFFPGPGRPSALVPWCTFTDPELAHVGLTTVEARAADGSDVEVHRLGLDHSDRARAESHEEGEVVVITSGGTIVGAHVLAPGAGEVIHELALAIDRGLALTDLAGLVHVYPTMATSVGALAAEAAYAGARRWHWLVRADRTLWRLRQIGRD